MIDNISKTMALMEKMRGALPIEAIATKELHQTLGKNSARVFPHGCRVTDVRYMNDEGGISCHLDFGFDASENVYVVSITHLRFDLKHPLRREIEAYCKHRIKRIKKLASGA